MSEPVRFSVRTNSQAQSLPSDSRLGTPPVADFGWVIILALPWVIFLAGNNWVFDYLFGQGHNETASYIDPWVYLGFFLDLRHHIQIFPDTYYGSRLSWILPGYLAYRIFPPLVATYVLHLGVYYAAVFSLYLTLKHTVGPRSALLGGILMGCYGYFLWAVGWDYVDGAGLSYFLMTIAALTYAATHRRSWAWLASAGALCGAMIYSQLFLIVFTPSLFLYYALANQEVRRYSLKISALAFGCGFLTISLFLGIMNRILGGSLLFYAPSVRAAIQLTSKANPWKVPFPIWSREGSWLVLLALTVLTSIAFLIVNRKAEAYRRIRFSIFFQLCFLMCAATSVLFEVKGDPVLELGFYASLLIPAMFLALGGQLSALVEGLSSRSFATVVCLAISCSVLPYRVIIPGLIEWLHLHGLFIVFVAASAALLGRFFRGAAATASALTLVCIVFSVVNEASVYFQATDSDLVKHGLSLVIESVEAIMHAQPSGQWLFWYRVSEPRGVLYRSIASTYLWGYSIINENFPSLTQGVDNYQAPASNEHLVLLSQDPAALQEANSALSQIGLGTQLMAKTGIQEGKFAWTLSFIKLHAWPMIEDTSLTSDQWPDRIKLMFSTSAQQVVSLSAPGIRRLFRSDMNSVTEWAVNRYGFSGGLGIQPNCLAIGDPCAVYSSGSPRDHLATPYVSLETAEPVHVFFSIWVKPLRAGASPRIFLQNENFLTMAEGEQLSSRQDGWVLDGGLGDIRKGQKVRLVVMSSGSATLLDKAEILELPDGSP